MKIRLLVTAVLTIFLIGCQEKTTTKVTPEMTKKDPVITTYYLVRHAEKDRSNPADKNPPLTQEGLLRAASYATILKDIPMDAVYATNYLRTQQTAQPVASMSNLEITTYEPVPEITFFKDQTKGQKVFVVGHSNTIPKLVNALIGKNQFSDINDTVNGNLYIVTLVDGIPTVSLLSLE